MNDPTQNTWVVEGMAANNMQKISISYKVLDTISIKLTSFMQTNTSLNGKQD